jgi:hypothetical protein
MGQIADRKRDMTIGISAPWGRKLRIIGRVRHTIAKAV